MQNLLILLFSFALGSAPIIRNTISKLAGALNSLGAAVIIIAGFSILLSFFNWGVGILGGIFLARETARHAEVKGLNFDYPLLLSAGLSGIVVWESGFSGIIPLYLAQDNHFLVKTIGPLGVEATILSPLNLGVTVALLIAIPLVLYLMRPTSIGLYKPEEPVPVSPAGEKEKSVAASLERSRILSLFFGGLALIYVIQFFASGKPLNLPNLLFALLALGIILHKELMDYPRNIVKGVRVIWFIVLPLMFYAAIQGVMNASGLNQVITNWLSATTTQSIPVIAMIVATIANFIVPNAGGQLILGGPAVMDAAQALDASYAKVSLALAYGAGLAKLLQLYIFTAAIGLSDGEPQISSLVKYTSVIFVVAFVICLIGLIALPA